MKVPIGRIAKFIGDIPVKLDKEYIMMSYISCPADNEVNKPALIASATLDKGQNKNGSA
jgi:hypothetical protein